MPHPRKLTEQTNECRTPGCRTRPEPGYAPRGLCGHCETGGHDAITALPEDWDGLQPLIWDTRPRTGQPGQVGAPFGPSLPFDDATEALAREICYTACLWEEIVRARARLVDPPNRGRQPDRYDLARAAETLAAHYSVLVACPRTDIVAYDQALAVADGPDAVVTLTGLHRRARSRVGQATREYTLPDACCSVCGFGQLRHRDGRDQVYCPQCHAVWTWDQYRDTVETALFGGPR